MTGTSSPARATAACELLDQAGALDVVIAPVGGGGLLAGTALAVKGRRPADERDRGRAGQRRRRPAVARGRVDPALHDPRTIADGLRTSLGTKTFAVIRGT